LARRLAGLAFGALHHLVSSGASDKTSKVAPEIYGGAFRKDQDSFRRTPLLR
jgi:hypothetical protein